MTRSNTIEASLGNDRTVTRSAASDQTVSEFFSWLSCAVRDRFRDKKIAVELASFLECDERSASRYLSGDRFPNGPQLLRFFEDDVLAPQIVSELLRRLPDARRAAMAKSVTEAADLVRMKAEQEILLRKIAEKEARR